MSKARKKRLSRDGKTRLDKRNAALTPSTPVNGAGEKGATNQVSILPKRETAGGVLLRHTTGSRDTGDITPSRPGVCPTNEEAAEHRPNPGAPIGF